MMKRRLLLGTGLAAAAGLAGCASQDLDGYAHEKPVLDLAAYFNGRVLAHGMFQDRSGQVVKRFTVAMDCNWSGNQGVLDEAFTYSDGSTQRRIWRVTRWPDGSYTGTADDVVGQAVGRGAGNALRWSYTLRLPVDTSVYEVDMDDWMYLIDERTLINRARMSKFGFHLGDVTLSFTKP